LHLVAAAAAEARTRRVLEAARAAFPAGRGGKVLAAVAAEAHARRVLGSALRASRKLHIRAAVVAELTRAGGLAADGANRCLTLDVALPYGGRLLGLVYVTLHSVRAGAGDVYLLPRRAGDAEPLVLVITMVAYIMVAGRAAVEMLLGLVLRAFKGAFMLLNPLRRFAVKFLRKNVCRSVRAVSKAAYAPAKQAARYACTLPKPAQKAALFICIAFDERGLVTILANVAVKGELEARVCGIVLIISCKCLQHVWFPPVCSEIAISF